MTRFLAPNLAGLPPPPAVETLDFEALLAARLADLSSRLTTASLPDVAAILTLETEPLVIDQETNAAFELLLRQRINEAVRANLWATATGASQDQLAATFYGISRLVITAADNDAVPPVAAVYETDDDFRARGVLSMEARSVAGPEGAYTYFALQADSDVKDAAVYGEEDGAYYGAVTSAYVLAPEVLVVILSHTGNGTAGSPLRNTVLAALNAEEIRPIGDKLTVESATITQFSVEGTIRYAPGADPAPLVAAAMDGVEAYVTDRHRVGRRQQRLGIAAAMKVTNVEEIDVVLKDEDGSVIASGDIDPGPKGAAFCTAISITPQVMTDSWS